MATRSSKAHCVKCGKERATLKCAGCSQDFCYNHLTDHRQELNQELDEIEVNRDLFRQTLNDHTTHPQIEPLIKQIDQWERNSINKIQQTAKEYRQLVRENTNKNIQQIEMNFNKLTDYLKEIHQENDFNEIDLNKLNEQLKQLEEELCQQSNFSIQEDSIPLVHKICLVGSSKKSHSSTNIHNNTKWEQDGSTIAGGNGYGNQLDQFSNPSCICIDDEDDQTIYIADFENDRIVQWKRGAMDGEVVAGGNGRGNRMNQLYKPTDVIVDKKNDSLIISDWRNRRVIRWSRRNRINQQIIISNISCYGLTMADNGDLYVSDDEKHEVRRWREGETNGKIVAGGNGFGNGLNQLNCPTFVFVDKDYSVYVSDTWAHRVMKWVKNAQEGIVVAGGNGQGNSLTQLDHPAGVFVDRLGNVYVVDCNNHRIMLWLSGASEGNIIVGGHGEGKESDQFDSPASLSFDREGNLYVVDRCNNRVQKFHVDLD